MPSKPNDSMLSAAGENEYAQLYAAVNFAQSKGGEDSSNAAEDAAMDQGAQMGGAAAAAALGLPPEIGAKAGQMLAEKMREDKGKDNEKSSSTLPTFSPSAAAPAA